MAAVTARVLAVRCGTDNLAYLLDGCRGEAVIIDPSAADPLLAVLAREKLVPAALCFTHHHGDHTAGVDTLRQAFPGLGLHGPAKALARLPAGTAGLHDGQVFEAAGIKLSVRATPGHTADSCCYACGMDLFTGDTLFGGGCGRLLGGSAAELHGSLEGLASTFPTETRVWYGHEYTVENLRFALSILPGDPAIRDRLAMAEAALAAGRLPLPATLALERATNLFLRCGEPALSAALGMPGADATAVFGTLRRRKDAW